MIMGQNSFFSPSRQQLLCHILTHLLLVPTRGDGPEIDRESKSASEGFSYFVENLTDIF